MTIRDDARQEAEVRPTIALAREIASWDQDNPGTGRIPHWAVNLAAHLIDKGYGQPDREPSDATLKESAPDLTRPGDMRSDFAYPSDAEVEAAADAIIEASFGQELPEAPVDLARAALLAAQEVRDGS